MSSYRILYNPSPKVYEKEILVWLDEVSERKISRDDFWFRILEGPQICLTETFYKKLLKKKNILKFDEPVVVAKNTRRKGTVVQLALICSHWKLAFLLMRLKNEMEINLFYYKNVDTRLKCPNDEVYCAILCNEVPDEMVMDLLNMKEDIPDEHRRGYAAFSLIRNRVDLATKILKKE